MGLYAAADINLMVWGLAWDAHALGSGVPLFDANIFHPSRLMLAATDHYLGHLPISGPVYALSGNPILAYQVNLLAMLALCGGTSYALLRHLGAPRSAAFYAGFLYAFCPVRCKASIFHAHVAAGQYLPLALLFLDRTLRGARRRDAALLGAALLLQMLCAYYMAYVALAALAGFGLAALAAGAASRRGLALALAGVGAAGAVTALVSLPYLELRHGGVIPTYDSSLLTPYAACHPLRNYLISPLLLRTGRAALDRGITTYVGLVPLALAVMAMRPRARRLAGRALPALLGLTAGTYLLSLGPRLEVAGMALPLPYALADALVPGFSSMRLPGRFGLGVMAGVASLAGLGLAHLLAGRGARARAAIVALLTVATAAEYDLLGPRPQLRSVDPPAEIHQALAELPVGPLLELPRGAPEDLAGPLRESSYMVASTRHWRPLINGYSGYPPRSHAPLMVLARAVPDPRALELLGRFTGVRYVLVHLARLPLWQRPRWDGPPGLRLAAERGTDRLFEVRSPPPRNLEGSLDVATAAFTPLGAPLAPLPPAGRRALLANPRPPGTTVAGLPFEVEVDVRNDSPLSWPALHQDARHLVMLGYAWRDGAGTTIVARPDAARLPFDLAPGQGVRAALFTVAPDGPPCQTLVVGTTQDGAWLEGTVEMPFEVIPRRATAR